MAPLGSEHPRCDTIQLVMTIMFFVLCGLGSFIFNYSTVLANSVLLPLRLLLGVLSAGAGIYLGVQSHNVVL